MVANPTNYPIFQRFALKTNEAYCLNNMKLADIGVPNYNQYCFLENTALFDSTGFGFPEWFNMFTYNDQECTLAFMGHFSEDYFMKDKAEVINNWSSFVEEYFPELGQGTDETRDDGTGGGTVSHLIRRN